MWNNKIFIILIIGLTTLFQQTLSNGFVLVILRSIEIRFGLNSYQIGLITTCYEIADTAFAVFVIYLIKNISKPISIGVGFILCSIGGIIFTLPHFLAGSYEINSVDECPDSASLDCDVEMTGRNKLYYALFILGMCIVGFGAIPSHSLIPVYIDENMSKHKTPLYHSIWLTFSLLGPVIGFIVGGLLLSVHTDFNQEILTGNLDNTSPIWVGAWWPGILGGAILCFVFAVVLVCLPERIQSESTENLAVSRDSSEPSAKLEHVLGELTDSANVSDIVISQRIRRSVSSPVSSSQESKDEEISGFAGFFKSFKILYTNPLFIWATLIVVSDAWIIQSLASFAVRYVQLNFNVSSMVASLCGAVSLIFGGLLGYLGNGIYLKRFDKTSKTYLRDITRSAWIGPVTGILGSLGFLIKCENIPIAGVNYAASSNHYDSSSSLGLLLNPSQTCDANACQNCDLNRFIPVCDTTANINYYNECLAGCTNFNGNDLETLSCFCSSASGGTANSLESGFCEANKCESWKLYLFVVCAVLIFFGPYWTAITIMNVTLRAVPTKLQTQAQAWQTTTARLLGSIPGPIAFGALLDSACVIWEKNFCEDTEGSCLLFNNNVTSNMFLGLCLISRVFNLIFVIGMMYFSRNK